MLKISFLEKFKTKEQLFINLSIFLYIAQVIYFSILHYLGHKFPETSFLFDRASTLEPHVENLAITKARRRTRLKSTPPAYRGE